MNTRRAFSTTAAAVRQPPDCSSMRVSRPWTTSAPSAARTPTAPTTANATTATSPCCMRYGRHQRRLLVLQDLQGTLLRTQRHAPVRLPACPRTRSSPSCTTSPRAAASARPAACVGVKKDTVIRYSLLAGEHAQQLHDELVAFSPQTDEVQFDEKWSFVGQEGEALPPRPPRRLLLRRLLGPCGPGPRASPGGQPDRRPPHGRTHAAVGRGLPPAAPGAG